jgi:hypothetical protein
LNQLKNVQKIENCRFNQHVTFHFWNWNLQFLHLPKNHVCLIRSWTGKSMVDKIQIFCIYHIWRCQMILTFSGLHFLFDPLELSTGACPTPSGTEIVKTHYCALFSEYIIMKYAFCVKVWQHNFTIVIVVKLLINGLCLEKFNVKWPNLKWW